MLNYYRTNEEGIITELISFADAIPVYDELGNIIGYTDDVNDYIKANYIKTTSEIIQSVDGTYIFAEEFNYEEEAKKKSKIEFEKAKDIKLNEARVMFAQKRDARRFIQLDENRYYGFDCANEDITNFLARWTPLAMMGGGESQYKVWLNETEKDLVMLSLADYNLVYQVVSVSQLEAYDWYKVVQTQINTCTTKEELEAIILE